MTENEKALKKMETIHKIMAVDITKYLAIQTKHKSIRDAYQADELEICLENNSDWWIKKCTNERMKKLVIKEMRNIFPEYMYKK